MSKRNHMANPGEDLTLCGLWREGNVDADDMIVDCQYCADEWRKIQMRRLQG